MKIKHVMFIFPFDFPNFQRRNKERKKNVKGKSRVAMVEFEII